MLSSGGSLETPTHITSCSGDIGTPLYRSRLPAVWRSSAFRVATGDAQRNRADVSELFHPTGSVSFACREESFCAPFADCFCGLVEYRPLLSDGHRNDSGLETRRPQGFHRRNYNCGDRMCLAAAHACETLFVCGGCVSALKQGPWSISPQCQRTTDRKQRDLDRIEHPLYNRYACFTGKNHKIGRAHV